MLFGGSSVSWSVTSDAMTVTVQVSEKAKSVVGSSENVVGPPLCTAACEPLVSHAIPYQAGVTSTGSLNVIVTFVLKPTPTAPASGEVAVTAGAVSPPHDALFCGSLGAIRWKSLALLSLSVVVPEAPPGFRS